MPAHARTAIVLACALALPCAALAQGTAPTQGVTRPTPQPAHPAGPPAPKPGELSDGRPRPDPGGGATSTAPETTGRLPLPPPGQATPEAKR